MTAQLDIFTVLDANERAERTAHLPQHSPTAPSSLPLN